MKVQVLKRISVEMTKLAGSEVVCPQYMGLEDNKDICAKVTEVTIVMTLFVYIFLGNFIFYFFRIEESLEARGCKDVSGV